MKHHPAWLAAGLLAFVVLACSLGKTNTNSNLNSNSNSNANSHSSTDVDLGSGNAITEVHMTRDNGNGAPGAETDTFAPADHTIHCVATLKKAKSGTQMRLAWWAVDVENTQNKKLQEINYTTKTFENIINGHLTYPQDWPKGKYKVQVYVNGDLDKTAFYTVE